MSDNIRFRIEETPSTTPDSVFDRGEQANVETASINGSVDSNSARSSLPSLSGILSSFSGRGDLWSTSSSTTSSVATVKVQG